MYINKDYLDPNGLLNARIYEYFGKNCLLFSLEYTLLRHNLNQEQDVDFDLNLIDNIIHSKSPLFENFRNARVYLSSNDWYISHDNLTAIFCASLHFNQDWHILIWNQIDKMRYDNVNIPMSWSRILHPRDYIFYGALAGNWICKVLLPFLAFDLFYAFINYGTSGKLLWFVRLFACRNKNLLLKLTWAILSRVVNWKSYFEIYFQDENHPIRECLNA